MNKKTVTVLIIILAVLVIAGGFWCANNQNNVIPEKSGIQNKQNSETISQNDQENKAEELKVEEIDTSNWKEYCNEEYGFCLKYPRKWKVTRRHIDAEEGVVDTFNSIVLSSRKADEIFSRININIYDGKVNFNVKHLLECSLKSKENCAVIKDIWLPEYWFETIKYTEINGQEFIFNDNKDNMIFATVYNNKYILFRNISDLTYKENKEKGVTISDIDYNVFMNILGTLKFTK